MPNFIVAALYKFAKLTDYQSIQPSLLDFCVAHNIKGTLLLAEEGINIQMISTSEIKIAVVIDEKYMELAVRVLHKAFELEEA